MEIFTYPNRKMYITGIAMADIVGVDYERQDDELTIIMDELTSDEYHLMLSTLVEDPEVDERYKGD